MSVALAAYLELQGYSPTRIGVLVTAMLFGSGALTLAVGTRGGRLSRRLLLRLGAALMIATGVTFGLTAAFGVLLVVGMVGTLNPTSGDVSGFLPLEQSVLTATVPDRQRTALFARYAFIGGTAAALGSLAVAIPDFIARRTSISEVDALRGVFVVYAIAGGVVLLLYTRLSPAVDRHGDAPPGPLGPSRSIVYRLAAVFSLDSFGGGFVVQSMLALWLLRRFDVSLAITGTLFFWTGLISGASAFVAVRLARQIGLIRTMAFTHLPANVALVAAAFAPNFAVAIALLVFRSLLSTMDVPARTSYVMAMVSPAERAAAASVTNVPRSMAAAFPPLLAGWMLDHSTFGWPLVVGGVLKGTYDLVLLGMFRHHRPPEERDTATGTIEPRVDTGAEREETDGHEVRGETTGAVPRRGRAVGGVARGVPARSDRGPASAAERCGGAAVPRLDPRRTRDDVLISWREGCPVHWHDLSVVRVAYWGYDGAQHLGSLVVHDWAAPGVRDVFDSLYRQRFQIRRIHLVDYYGADDNRSMAANNTSAFNCRRVAGSSSWSMHSYGTAVDVNPMQNPYVSGGRYSPPGSEQWANRRDVVPGMAVEGNALVGAFDYIGWKWGGRWTTKKDYQHFSINGR